WGGGRRGGGGGWGDCGGSELPGPLSRAMTNRRTLSASGAWSFMCTVAHRWTGTLPGPWQPRPQDPDPANDHVVDVYPAKGGLGGGDAGAAQEFDAWRSKLLLRGLQDVCPHPKKQDRLRHDHAPLSGLPYTIRPLALAPTAEQKCPASTSRKKTQAVPRGGRPASVRGRAPDASIKQQPGHPAARRIRPAPGAP